MKGNDIQPCIAVMNIIRILFCGRLREKGPIDIFHLWFSNILFINRLCTANLHSTNFSVSRVCVVF